MAQHVMPRNPSEGTREIKDKSTFGYIDRSLATPNANGS